METIEIHWDANGHYGNLIGCWRAHVKSNEGIHGVGLTPHEAKMACIKVASSQGFSDDQNKYAIEQNQNVHVHTHIGSTDFGGTRLIVERCPYCKGRHVHHTRFDGDSYNRVAECGIGEYHMLLD